MPQERPYLDPYLRAAEDHGPGFDALLWHSPKAQQTRFRVIAQMVNTTGRTLADIGCGNADLLVELHRRERAPCAYIGVDAVPQTLEHARKNVRAVGIEHADFADHDFVRDAQLADLLVGRHGVDTIVFCGSLNTLPREKALTILGRFWEPLSARKDAVLLFNFLSDRHDRDRTPATPPAVRFDAVEMVHWALDRTPLVTFRHEYLGGHDATVCMRTPSTTTP